MGRRLSISVLGFLAIAVGACGDHRGGGAPHERDAAAGAPGGGGYGAAGAGDESTGGGGSGVEAGAGGGGICPPSATCSVPGCGTPGPLPGGIALTGVWIGPAREVWAVGEAGFVGRRDPDTSAWCWCAPAPPKTLRAVWGASSRDVFVVGDAGTLLRLDGARWVRYPFRVSPDLHAVHGTAADNVWAVGHGGAALRFDGADWRTEYTDTRYDLGAVWIDEAGVVHAAGSALLPVPDPSVEMFTVEAAFLRHAPGAVGWEVEGSIRQRGGIDVRAMMGASPTDIWAGGTDYPSGAAQGYGGVFHFDGVTWMRAEPVSYFLSNNTITDVAVATPDDNATWVVGTRESLRFDGSNWTEKPELAGAAAIDARGAEMYAAGANGVVFHWTTATGWTIDRPASPPSAVDAP